MNVILLFPNPLNDEKVMLHINHFKELRAFNHLGERLRIALKQLNENTLMVDTTAFPTGTYYLTFFTENNRVIPKKIVVE
jgi:hypothetical protein